MVFGRRPRKRKTEKRRRRTCTYTLCVVSSVPELELEESCFNEASFPQWQGPEIVEMWVNGVAMGAVAGHAKMVVNARIQGWADLGSPSPLAWIRLPLRWLRLLRFLERLWSN